MNKNSPLKIIAIAIVSILFLHSNRSAAWAFDIVRDGKPAAVIVVPRHDGDAAMKKWTRKPARWLQQYIKKASGADLEIVEEGRPVEGNVISVGHTEMARNAGIKLDGLKWDGCRLIVKGNTLFLIGRDEMGPAERDYVGAKGTCMAAAAFLAEHMGIKWFIPSPMGELVPKTNNIAVSDNLDKRVQPRLAFFHGPYFYGIGTPASFANQNRTAVRVYMAAGHTWQPFVSAKEYFFEHPEYFALIGGVRWPGPRYDSHPYYRALFSPLILPQAFSPGYYRNYLCTSNPEVKRILIREVRKRFDEGYDWVELGQADGYRRCECPKCEALDNYRSLEPISNLRKNPCERIHLLHKAVIDECRRSHPDKTVLLLAYGPTIYPSKAFDRYGDNVLATTCAQEQDVFDAWQGKVGGMVAYTYWWRMSHPARLGLKTDVSQIASEVQTIYKNRCLGIYLCGGGDCWGLDGPGYYASARLAANPELDYRDCIDEYCRFIYGEAGKTMSEFFTFQYEKKGRRDLKKLYADAGRPKKVPGGTRNAYAHYLCNYPPETIERLERLLARAETETNGERAKGWLRLTRDSFELTKAYAASYECYRLYDFDKTPENLDRLQKAINTWKPARDKLLAYGKDEQYAATWFPNWKVAHLLFAEVTPCQREVIGDRQIIGKLFTEDLQKLLADPPRDSEL